jgi:hypothetical protein
MSLFIRKFVHDRKSVHDDPVVAEAAFTIDEVVAALSKVYPERLRTAGFVHKGRVDSEVDSRGIYVLTQRKKQQS